VIEIDLIYLNATEKGVLVEHGVEPVWLPRAHVRYPAGLQRGDEATFEVAGWLVKKKGLDRC
jgi:hypothetical protein